MILVDDGGYFPDAPNQQDVAWFMMDAMKLLGTDAVGVGERDLKYGLAWLKSQNPKTVAAKGARVPGKGKRKAIEDAPGRYVKEH